MEEIKNIDYYKNKLIKTLQEIKYLYYSEIYEIGKEIFEWLKEGEMSRDEFLRTIPFYRNIIFPDLDVLRSGFQNYPGEVEMINRVYILFRRIFIDYFEEQSKTGLKEDQVLFMRSTIIEYYRNVPDWFDWYVSEELSITAVEQEEKDLHYFKYALPAILMDRINFTSGISLTKYILRISQFSMTKELYDVFRTKESKILLYNMGTITNSSISTLFKSIFKNLYDYERSYKLSGDYQYSKIESIWNI